MDKNVTITTTYIYISKNHHLIMTKVEIRIGKPQVLIFIGSAKLGIRYNSKTIIQRPLPVSANVVTGEMRNQTTGILGLYPQILLSSIKYL